MEDNDFQTGGESGGEETTDTNLDTDTQGGADENQGDESSKDSGDGSGDTDPFADINNNEDLFQWQKEQLIAERKAEIAEREKLEAEEAAKKAGKPVEDKDKAKLEADKKAKEQKEQTQPSLHKVKIDGKEYEVDTEELKRGYQLAKASQTKINQAHELSQKAQLVFRALENGPEGLLNLVEVVYKERAHEVIEQALAKRLEVLMMSPEKRQAYELQKELERRDAIEAERKQKEMDFQKAEMVKRYQEQFKSAAEKIQLEAGLPNNTIVQGLIYQTLQAAIEKGIDVTDPMKLVPYVQKRFEQIRKDMFITSPEEAVKYFGEQIEESWRSHLNKKYDSKVGNGVKPSAKDAPKAGNKPANNAPKYKNWDEWSAAKDKQLKD